MLKKLKTTPAPSDCLLATCSHGGDDTDSPALCLHREPVLRLLCTNNRQEGWLRIRPIEEG